MERIQGTCFNCEMRGSKPMISGKSEKQSISFLLLNNIYYASKTHYC